MCSRILKTHTEEFILSEAPCCYNVMPRQLALKNLNIRRISGIGNCLFERQSYWPKIADIPGILQTIVLVENIQIVGANDQFYQLHGLTEELLHSRETLYLSYI